jgi:Radical SAM superfamily
VSDAIDRASVRLTTRCDDGCVFCGQHGIEARDQDDWPAALARARESSDEVSFVGGEPTLSPVLVDAVAQARSLGFRAIGLQTHGRHLAGGALLDALVAAGLGDAQIGLHGGRADVHDYHVGTGGSFVAVRAAIAELRARGITVVVTTMLTRSSFRVLGEVPPLLATLGVAAWRIDVPHTAGRAALELDRVVPRLALALPFALHALDRAHRSGIAVGIAGAPACLLGPWASSSHGSVLRSFAATCEGCAARPRCVGLDAAYLARFGGDELRARGAVSGRSSMPARLARMFVGSGELVTATVAGHESPQQARTRLAVIGKVAPALGEVRGRATPDGEGLRTIFPGLFDEE